MEKEIEEIKTEKEPTEKEIQTMRSEIAAEEFNETSVPKPEPKVETEPEEELELKKEAGSEIKPKVETEDLWAGANPALRETFDEMSAKIKDFDTMATRLKQTENRIGAIQNKLHVAEQEAKKSPVPTKAEIDKAAAEEESWEMLREDFPEWAEAIDVRMAKSNSKLESVQEDLKNSQAASTQRMESEIAKLQGMTGKVEESLLEFKHPIWRETIETSEYKEWIEKQSEGIKKLTLSKFAKDAIKVLDRFEKTQNTETQNKSPAEIAAERKKRLAEAVFVKGKKAKPVKAEIDMSDEKLRKKIAAEVWAE